MLTIQSIDLKKQKKHADFIKYREYYRNYYKITEENNARYVCQCGKTASNSSNMFVHFRIKKHKNDALIKYYDKEAKVNYIYEK